MLSLASHFRADFIVIANAPTQAKLTHGRGTVKLLTARPGANENAIQLTIAVRVALLARQISVALCTARAQLSKSRGTIAPIQGGDNEKCKDSPLHGGAQGPKHATPKGFFPSSWTCR